MDFYLMVTRLRADYLLQDVAIQQGVIPQATAVLFPCPVKVFLWAEHLIISLCLSRSLSLMYSLLFNQVWVHTVFSPLAMTCPDLLTSIQPLLFTKSSGTIIETSYPSVKFGWNWPTSSNVFAGSQTEMHKKDHTSLISLGNQAKIQACHLFRFCPTASTACAPLRDSTCC